MLRITVELLPLGDESRREVLCVGEIANDGTGTLGHGNYKVGLSTKGQARTWKRGVVKGFPRRRLNAWDLLYRALRDCVAERNP